MMQFNPDGSLKLSSSTVKRRQDDELRMKNARCMHIRREMVSFSAPKKCILRIRLSEKITDDRFVANIQKQFSSQIETPTRLIKIGEREFDLEVGTNFRRCTDCTRLRGQYREFLDGDLIDEKGNCTFEGLGRSFCYEDYFD